MSLLVDWQIRELCVPGDGRPPGWRPMIEPFSETVGGGGVISWGLDHAGYCLRLAPEILVFKSTFGEVIDPKYFRDPDYCRRVLETIDLQEEKSFILPAGHYCLGRSYETLRIPRHLKGRCVGKSTWARAGILINTTPAEPAWTGQLVIEIGNVSGGPVRLHIMEGIAQMEFEELAATPEVSYDQKYGGQGGIYQNQQGVVPPRVRT